MSSDSFYHPIHKPLEGPKEGVERYKLSASYSVRHRHVLRLYDILQHLVSLPPSHANSVLSLRAWRALAKCKEVDLKAMYQLGGKILERTRELTDNENEAIEAEWRQGRRAEWLKWSRNGQHDRVDKLSEYILTLVAAGKPRDALDELETFESRLETIFPFAVLTSDSGRYLPAHPYNGSISLNVFAGYLCLLIAQPPTDHRDLSSDSDSDDNDGDAHGLAPPINAFVEHDEKSAPDNIRGRGLPDQANLSQRFSSRNQKPNVSTGSLAADYTPFLDAVAQYAPSRVSQAVNHFRRASRLERKAPELSFDEGARWLRIVSHSNPCTAQR